MESRKQSAIGRCATKKKKKKKKKILLRNARTARNDADPVFTLLMTEMCFYSPKINDNELPLVAASTDSVRVCVCLCQSVCVCVCSAAVSLCVCVAQPGFLSLSLLFSHSRGALTLPIQFPPMSEDVTKSHSNRDIKKKCSSVICNTDE